MIIAIEKNNLDDDFIVKTFIKNMNINNRLNFNKDDIYYFGNYNKDMLNKIEKKLINNKKSLIKAIESGTKFLIYGNSIDIFNNSFKRNKLNIFTVYDNKNINIRNNKMKVKNKYNKSIKQVYGLNIASDNINFRYKNLVCFKNKKAIEKQSISTLSYLS